MSTTAPAIPGYCVDEQCACHSHAFKSERERQWTIEQGLPEWCCTRCGRRGPKPLTIVPPQGAISFEALADRIRTTQREHGQLLNDYHRVWYESGHTWVYCHFAGVGLMKNPNDLWIYQELITATRPKTILETGTYSGGSALWFAFLMDLLGIEGGRVLTVDLDDHRQCTHPRITFFGGDSTDPDVAAAVLSQVQQPLMVVLDADHSAAHVRKELEFYAPAVPVGHYLVVEDTNIGWSGPEGDRGARGGIEDYLLEHPGEFRQDLIAERFLLTMNPGGWLQRMRACDHG